jgi:hypothetical protein
MTGIDVRPGTVVMYSDIGCPWASLALHRLRKRRAELGLDDVVVEACKAAVMRGSRELPFNAGIDLRLLNLNGDKLVMGWQRAADGTIGDMLGVPKKLYDAIAANEDGRWSSLRDEFEGKLFVDLNRMLIEQPA